MLVAVQMLVLGLYLPPVFNAPEEPSPPQTIIPLEVHTAVCPDRGSGALVVLVAVQLSVPGLYLPPVFRGPPLPSPPQTIISLPVQTELFPIRAVGTLAM